MVYDVGYSSEICAICLCRMDDQEDVKNKGGNKAHIALNNGTAHAPMHNNCLIAALKVKDLCPICRMPLMSLLPWKDKAVIELNHLIKDAHRGAAIGALMGAIFAEEISVGSHVPPGIITLIGGIAYAHAVEEIGIFTFEETEIAGLGAVVGIVGLMILSEPTIENFITRGAIIGGGLGGMAFSVLNGFLERRLS